MGRPSMPPGTHGKITLTELDVGWRARTLFRDYDGERREIARTGATKAKAEQAIAVAIRDRSAPAHGKINPSTKVKDLAAHWAEHLAEQDVSAGTLRVYTTTADSLIVPALGGLRLRELSVQTLDQTLQTVRKKNGGGAAKTARSVLSGMLAVAVRYGALQTNLARDTSPINRKPQKPIRALTIDETDAMLAAMYEHPRAVKLDLPDLVTWMLGTGVRIGEACAARDDAIKGSAFEVNATVVRVKGEGLTIQMRPKTAAGHRILSLAPDLIDMKTRRAKSKDRARGPHGVLFASPRGHLRDPNNTSGDLRDVLDDIDFDWVTSHVFRKTVATRLDEAGYTAREIADILGHEKPSMTQDVYMGRKVVSSRMALTLSRPDSGASASG